MVKINVYDKTVMENQEKMRKYENQEIFTYTSM